MVENVLLRGVDFHCSLPYTSTNGQKKETTTILPISLGCGKPLIFKTSYSFSELTLLWGLSHQSVEEGPFMYSLIGLMPWSRDFTTSPHQRHWKASMHILKHCG